MHELLNVLYVLTQGAVLHLDHDAVRVEVERETRLRAPLLRLGGIVVSGQVTVTPFLIQRCAEDGRSLVWLDRNGRFKARVEGRTRGNVLLRRAQHLALSDVNRRGDIGRQIVAAKIQNSRQVILRAAREATDAQDEAELSEAGERLASILKRLPALDDLDIIRGAEGEAPAPTSASLVIWSGATDPASPRMAGHAGHREIARTPCSRSSMPFFERSAHPHWRVSAWTRRSATYTRCAPVARRSRLI